MKHRKSKLDALSEKHNNNKRAGPKHNRRSIKLLNKTYYKQQKITIPKTSSEAKRRPAVAWWNKKSEREERIARAEYRKH